jgi:hypothetical protein
VGAHNLKLFKHSRSLRHAAPCNRTAVSRPTQAHAAFARRRCHEERRTSVILHTIVSLSASGRIEARIGLRMMPPVGIEIERAVGEGFPGLLFRLQGGFTVSPWRTCQGLEPDPGNLAVRDFRGASRNVRRVPSHGLERFKRWFVYTLATLGLPTASPLGPSIA